MTEEQSKTLKTFLATPEGRAELAAAMTKPFRCGGSGYDDGRRYVIAGGRKVYVDTPEYKALVG